MCFNVKRTSPGCTDTPHQRCPDRKTTPKKKKTPGEKNKIISSPEIHRIGLSRDQSHVRKGSLTKDMRFKMIHNWYWHLDFFFTENFCVCWNLDVLMAEEKRGMMLMYESPLQIICFSMKCPELHWQFHCGVKVCKWDGGLWQLMHPKDKLTVRASLTCKYHPNPQMISLLNEVPSSITAMQSSAKLMLKCQC